MLKSSIYAAALVAVLLVTINPTDARARPDGHGWQYPKPDPRGQVPEEHWGDRCDKGDRQSPIDLTYKAAVVGHFPTFGFDNYDEAIKDAALVHTGHSIQINAHPEQDMWIMGGGLPGRYRFDQMHFHWSSEHTIDSDHYAVELHIVHHEEHYNTLGDAAKTKKGIAVLGILFQIGEKNPYLETILNAVDGIKDHVGRNQTLTHDVELIDFLPKDHSRYFRYEGSLTTPGCSQSVIWTVFTDPLSLSLDQLERLKEIKTEEGDQLLYNFRSVKPLNARALVYVPGEEHKEVPVDNGASAGRLQLLLFTIIPLLAFLH